MRFPNLIWAIENARLRHYELADRLGIETSRFSRCLRGRFDFSAPERKSIAAILSYPEKWLFREPSPPVSTKNAEPIHAEALLGRINS